LIHFLCNSRFSAIFYSLIFACLLFEFLAPSSQPVFIAPTNVGVVQSASDNTEENSLETDTDVPKEPEYDPIAVFKANVDHEIYKDRTNHDWVKLEKKWRKEHVARERIKIEISRAAYEKQLLDRLKENKGFTAALLFLLNCELNYMDERLKNKSTISEHVAELFGALERLDMMPWLDDYPVYLLYTGDCSQIAPMVDKNHSNTFWVDVNEVFTAPKEFQDREKNKIRYGNYNAHKLSYRSMCDFWTRKVFNLDQVKSLDYYMRLDTDTLLYTEMDAFEKMHATDSVYGYYNFHYDTHLGEFMNEFLNRYVERHNLTPFHYINQTFEGMIFPNGYRKTPMFYTNLEICKISHFHSEDVRKFNDALDRSKGIYEYCWGDALTRWFQVMMFTSKVHCFDDFEFINHQGQKATCHKLAPWGEPEYRGLLNWTESHWDDVLGKTS